MIPSRGRPGLTLLMSIQRELTAVDLIRLSTSPRTHVGAPVLQRLKANHHAAARLIASGLSAVEVAHQVGLTPQRVRDLERDDPAFKDLVENYYRQMQSDAVVETSRRVNEKLVILAESSVDILLERVDDPAKVEAMPTSEIRQIAQLGLDRTVAPPKTATPAVVVPTHVTFNMGARDIRPKTIDQDGTPVPDSTEDSKS